MSKTEGTTPAPKSATPTDDQVDVDELGEPAGEDYLHYYWVSDPLAQNICGMPTRDRVRPKRHRIVEDVGQMMAVKEPRDCPACVHVLELTWELGRARRELESVNRLITKLARGVGL